MFDKIILISSIVLLGVKVFQMREKVYELQDRIERLEKKKPVELTEIQKVINDMGDYFKT